MKNRLIIYATVTKHSKKIAEALGQQFNIPVHNIADEPELMDVDLLFIVGGIYGGVSSPKLIAYVKNLQQNSIKKAVIITSCLSKRQKQDEIRHILASKGIEVIDEFICRGGFLFLFMRHPNKNDIENILSFSSNIIESES